MSVEKLITKIVNWGRLSSLWPVMIFNGCCDPEYMSLLCPRYDVERFGVAPAFSSRQADLLIVLGVVTEKMGKRIKMIYDQMPEPKYVIAMGDCAISGGVFWDSDTVVKGVDKIVPVDVYVAGCPPRPEAFIEGIRKLQDKIRTRGLK
ncbi:MAG TPA: NADH-quinone oxidoreductase subunit NuoB [archaeon]|nr:NADH-quinone oxidoreductase subunit NuoB [archaeon]